MESYKGQNLMGSVERKYKLMDHYVKSPFWNQKPLAN